MNLSGIDEYYPQFPYATQLRTGSPTQHGFGLGQAPNNDSYYCTSYPWAGMAFQGLGEVPHVLGDKGLSDAIDALIRGATVSAMKEGELAGLGGVDDATLGRAIYRRTLQGLANGDIEPLTPAEYDRELLKMLSGDNELAGFFSKLVAPLKKVKKAIDKVTKPIRHKIETAVKKVVPVVVAGAATYFTGGAALPVLKKFSPTISKYWKGWDKTVGKVLGGAPPAQPPQQEVQYITDPAITDASVPMAQYQLQQQGINMQSPQAQATLAAYVRGQQMQFAQASGNPNLYTGGAPKSVGGSTAQMAIPLAIGAAALAFMMK